MSYFTAQNEQSWVHVMARGPRPVGNRFALEAKVMWSSQWRNVQACMAWSSGIRAASPPQPAETGRCGDRTGGLPPAARSSWRERVAQRAAEAQRLAAARGKNEPANATSRGGVPMQPI